MSCKIIINDRPSLYLTASLYYIKYPEQVLGCLHVEEALALVPVLVGLLGHLQEVGGEELQHQVDPALVKRSHPLLEVNFVSIRGAGVGLLTSFLFISLSRNKLMH